MDSNSPIDEEDGVAERSPDGRYIRYDETLGSGAFKVVYKGFDEIDGIEIAWNKISVSDDVSPLKAGSSLRFKSLRHENITKCYCCWFDHEDKSINMITELFTSGSLRAYRQKHKQVELKAIKNWARQILKGLCYLHALDPPVVHRNLMCDNVFINGNHSQVKIGDLGSATILRQGLARTVIGTPEFMAPEMFEDEYDELVDVYAFGMCVLELVTCEHPYSECKNAGQIYKKVLSGVKPAALGKVKDLQVREFVEKCLVPASQRMSALELLNDPFLLPDKSTPMLIGRHSDVVPKAEIVPTPEWPISVDIGSDFGGFSNESSPASTLEYCRGRDKEYRLRGEKIDDNCILFTLWITGLRRDTFSFKFDLRSDSVISITRELAELELDIAKFEADDVVPVTELMDRMLSKFVPTWIPTNLDEVKTSHYKSLTFYESDFSDKSAVSFIHSPNTEISDSDSSMSSSLPVAATAHEKDDSQLEVEVDASDSQVTHCCRQLLKEEDKVETAKKRWTSYLRMAFV